MSDRRFPGAGRGIFLCGILLVLFSCAAADPAFAQHTEIDLPVPVAMGVVGGEGFLAIELPSSAIRALDGTVEEAVLDLHASGVLTDCLEVIPFESVPSPMPEGELVRGGAGPGVARSACPKRMEGGGVRFGLSVRRPVNAVKDEEVSGATLIVGRVTGGGGATRLSSEVIESLASEGGAWSARLLIWTYREAE